MVTTPKNDKPIARHDVDALYRRYGPMVLRRAQRLLSAAEAEELVHDVFLKLIEDPAIFRGECAPVTWLYRVATRLCLERLRSRARRTELIVQHAPAVFPGVDPGGTPEARVFLSTLWQTLDEELAMIGILYYVDGLTTADIGRTLGVSDRTVANRLTALADAARAAAGEPLAEAGMSAPSSSPPPPPPGEHLSEMAYDRLQVEPRASDPAFFAAAEAHLAACTACRAAFEALRAHDAGFALEPSWPVRRRARDKRIALHTRIATGLGAAGALAAGLVLATRTDPAPPDPDTVRVRGGALEVALHVEAGNGARRIDDGAVVHPGDRIGFAARTPKAAWLLVFGWDDSGVAYPIFPAGDAARAAPFGPNDTLVPLDVAIALDDVLGREHLAAIVCPHAFTRAAFVADARRVDGAALARAVAADEGCAVRTFTLTKTR